MAIDISEAAHQPWCMSTSSDVVHSQYCLVFDTDRLSLCIVTYCFSRHIAGHESHHVPRIIHPQSVKNGLEVSYARHTIARLQQGVKTCVVNSFHTTQPDRPARVLALVPFALSKMSGKTLSLSSDSDNLSKLTFPSFFVCVCFAHPIGSSIPLSHSHLSAKAHHRG